MGVVNVNAGDAFGFATSLIERLFPSEATRQEALLKLKELDQAGELAQISVNTQEAKHESLFVAGWRPFIGWVCGGAFAYVYVFQPFLVFVAWVVAKAGGGELPINELPAISLSELMPVLLGLLGLGWMRSTEKVAGVAGPAAATPKARG